MKKNRIKLTESQLHRVIKESIRRVLRESQNINEKNETYALVLYSDGSYGCETLIGAMEMKADGMIRKICFSSYDMNEVQKAAEKMNRKRL